MSEDKFPELHNLSEGTPLGLSKLCKSLRFQMQERIDIEAS